MAKKKRKSPRPAVRKAPAKKTASKRRKQSRGMGFMDTLIEVGKGVAGAIVISKFGHMVPVQNEKVRNGLLLGGGVLLAKKPGPMRSFGLGAAVASGTLLANSFVPNLLSPSTMPIGRVSPETMRRMQAAAEQIRKGGRVNGYRSRTIVGTGEGGDFPQAVNGSRNRTIVGSGDPNGFSY